MHKKLLFVGLACLATPALFAQNRLSDSAYAHASLFLGYKTMSLVDNLTVTPSWLTGDKFWYRRTDNGKTEFILVDPRHKTRKPAFDHLKLARALSLASGKQYDAGHLPFDNFSFLSDGQSIIFRADGKSWKVNLNQYTCAETQALPQAVQQPRGRRNGTAVVSPDGKKAAFIREYNLWIKDNASGKETQLTFDGEKNFGYATDNAGWKSGDGPILRWSPDSKKIATFQQDERRVGDMYLVSTNVGHPTLKAWKYPLPGDSVIATIQRVIIEVDNPKVIRLQVPPDPHRATLSDDIASSGTFDDVDWTEDGTELAFVSTSRDHKQEKFRIADARTGAVREVFEENVPTQYESGQGMINWHYYSRSQEIVWYSERDNWGHLYLYDAKTGKLKNQITRGNWLVTQLLKVDETRRQLYFLAVGRETVNPYFAQLCRIDFSGKNFKLLTPEEGNHQIRFSPSGDYFVDSYSQPDVPPVTVLRDLNGNPLAVLEKADISRLTAGGWKAPVPVKLKAADGQTDIYGLVFTPTHLDPGKKYPVVDYIYPGPQGGSVGSWSFVPSRGDNQALSELGFMVVAIEGTSNPLRSKSFHDMSYGNMAINTLPDQITAIRQLATRFPIDTTRVGIWGHSGGGFATATALFRYPDFFKVGISESGNHDNRNYEDDWGERYNGLAQNADYAAQANENYAKNLKGKLLLAHGLMDNNVPPYNTLLVVDALIKANKDFDLIVFPNRPHGYGPFSNYMMRRRWDYFVKNLLGAEPPKEYPLGK